MGRNPVLDGTTNNGSIGRAGTRCIILKYDATGQRGEPGMGAKGTIKGSPPDCLGPIEGNL